MTELLGRVRYQRRAAVDGPSGYRNGYPRVRGLEERFESRILPLFVRRTREVSELFPELYLHGLAEGNFDLALRGLLGEGAPVSATRVREGSGDLKKGLGTDGDLIPLLQGALGAPENHERGGITPCGVAATDGCRRAVQESGAGNGGNPEDADGN